MSRKRITAKTRVLHAMTSTWTGTVTEVLRNGFMRVAFDDGQTAKVHRDLLMVLRDV